MKLSVYENPSISMKLSVYEKSSISMKLSVYEKPSISMKLSVYEKPSISIKLSVYEKCSISTMVCPIYQFPYFPNVLSMICSIYDMFYLWYVLSMICPNYDFVIYELSFYNFIYLGKKSFSIYEITYLLLCMKYWIVVVSEKKLDKKDKMSARFITDYRIMKKVMSRKN